MRKAFLLLFAFSLCINVFSQFDKHKISLSVGPSFSVGEYGSKSITNKNSGYADKGINLYLYYCYNVTRNFSVGTKIFYNTNKSKTDAVITDLNYSTGTNWTTNASSWTSQGYMLGVTAHVPKTKKFIIDFRFYGGYIFLNSPAYTLTNGTLSTSYDKASGKSLGYSIGTGFSYFINKRFDILFNIDYIATNTIFKDYVTRHSSGYVTHAYDYRRTFDILNATIGVGYNFTKIFKK